MTRKHFIKKAEQFINDLKFCVYAEQVDAVNSQIRWYCNYAKEVNTRFDEKKFKEYIKEQFNKWKG